MIINSINNTIKRNLITIDGLSGSGKTSISKHISEYLNAGFLSSGLLFRVIAYKYIYYNIKDENDILISESDLCINSLNSDEISKKASELAKNSKIREFAKNYQREYVTNYSGDWFVLEGRDCGTAVFPDADIKIFLTASPEIRSRRRYLELSSPNLGKDSNVNVIGNEVTKNLLERDKEDSNRDIDPVKPAKDAYIVDNSDMDFEETCDHIIKHILSHKNYKK